MHSYCVLWIRLKIKLKVKWGTQWWKQQSHSTRYGYSLCFLPHRALAWFSHSFVMGPFWFVSSPNSAFCYLWSDRWVESEQSSLCSLCLLCGNNAVWEGSGFGVGLPICLLDIAHAVGCTCAGLAWEPTSVQERWSHKMPICTAEVEKTCYYSRNTKFTASFYLVKGSGDTRENRVQKR